MNKNVNGTHKEVEQVYDNHKVASAIVERYAEVWTRTKSPLGLLSRGDLSLLFGFNVNGSVMRGMLNHPDFPKPIYIGEREPRWRASDVDKYLQLLYKQQVC